MDPALLQNLQRLFFQVVPPQFKTYCAFTSSIACEALRQLGHEAEVQACQIWYATPNRNYVVGFLGHDPRPNKWDGHAVCRVGPWLLDTATHHFAREFRLPVPDTLLLKGLGVRSHALARMPLAGEAMLWWLSPPAGAELRLPDSPADLVRTHARGLVRALRASADTGLQSRENAGFAHAPLRLP